MIKNRRQAFTLAETLITLAIIGVVASLTIPTLMKSYEKQQWISGYKSTYSMINQATRMIMADNGGALLNTWAGSVNGMFNAYIPYLKISKRCENQSAAGNCFASSYKDLNGDDCFMLGGSYSVILTNGVSISFLSALGTSAQDLESTIYIDTNGKKGPNVWGKDFHFIGIKVNSDPVKPSGWTWASSDINTRCPSDLSSSFGSSCGVRILRGDYAEDY